MAKKKKRENFKYALYPKNYSLTSILERNRRNKMASDEWDVKLFSDENVESEIDHVKYILYEYKDDGTIVSPDTFKSYIAGTHLTDEKVAQGLIDLVLERNRTIVLNRDTDFLKEDRHAPKMRTPEPDDDFDLWDDRKEDGVIERAANFVFDQLRQIGDLNEKYDEFYSDKDFLVLRCGQSDTILVHTDRPKALYLSIDHNSLDTGKYLVETEAKAFTKNVIKITVHAKQPCCRILKASDLGMRREIRIPIISVE